MSSCSIIWDLQWYLITKLSSKDLHFSAVSDFPAATADTSPALFGWLSQVSAASLFHHLPRQRAHHVSRWSCSLGVPQLQHGPLHGPLRHLAVVRVSGIVRLSLVWPKHRGLGIATLHLVHRGPLYAARIFTESIPNYFHSSVRYRRMGFGELTTRHAEHLWFLLTIGWSHTDCLNVALAPPSLRSGAHKAAWRSGVTQGSLAVQAAHLILMKGNSASLQLHSQGPPCMQAQVPDLLPGGHKKVFKDNLFLPSNNSNS